jgi:small GTP-binding protein
MSILRARVIIAGEPTVGKTCLVNQVCKQSFNHNYMMTQGCEYNVKEVPIEGKSYQRVELHLIDIAGQNIFKEITFELLGKANLIMLVYDVTNPDTFHLLRQWLEGIKQHNQGRPLMGVVVANKIDIENRIAVGPQDGLAFAKSIGFEFFEVSTLQAKNIEDPFKCLAEMFYRRYQEKANYLMHM